MPDTPAIRRLPPRVSQAMREHGVAATCLAVQLDGAAWEAALFLRCSGPECREDRRLLRRSRGSIPVGIEADLIEHASAAVVALRAEAHTGAGDPLVFEILVVPGHAASHFDPLKLLTTQPRLCWFFADSAGEIIHAQQHLLAPEHHAGFAGVLDDALKHDRLIRLTQRYSAEKALEEIGSHYARRAPARLAT